MSEFLLLQRFKSYVVYKTLLLIYLKFYDHTLKTGFEIKSIKPTDLSNIIVELKSSSGLKNFRKTNFRQIN